MDPKEHSKTKSHKLNCEPNHSIGPSHCKGKIYSNTWVYSLDFKDASFSFQSTRTQLLFASGWQDGSRQIQPLTWSVLPQGIWATPTSLP